MLKCFVVSVIHCLNFSPDSILGFTCSFKNSLFDMMFGSCIIGNVIMTTSLYRLNVKELVSFHTSFTTICHSLPYFIDSWSHFIS